MKIAVHHDNKSYSKGLIEYLTQHNIEFKIVNAYSSSIIFDLIDCDAFFWHFFHNDPKDVLFAKQLLFSVQSIGLKVFPDFNTTWHFDDKVGQKYLLEAHNMPLIPSYVGYTKKDALGLLKLVQYPIVFKLRGGAGSRNVSLIRNHEEAIKKINKAFGRGFRQFDPYSDFLDSFNSIRKNGINFLNIKNIFKSLAHFVIPYQIEKVVGRERGYFYFQQFIPNCLFDYRVQFIGDICYAMKRYVREGDFRASGGGNIDYDGSKVPIEVIKISKRVKESLQMQTMAVDILDTGKEYLIAEVSYAFAIDEGECDFGYYDNDLNWVKEKFNPYEFMVNMILRS